MTLAKQAPHYIIPAMFIGVFLGWLFPFTTPMKGMFVASIVGFVLLVWDERPEEEEE